MNTKFSLIHDVNTTFLEKIKKNKYKYAIYQGMVKLEKMGIFLSDYSCFCTQSWYTGKKNIANKKVS